MGMGRHERYVVVVACWYDQWNTQGVKPLDGRNCIVPRCRMIDAGSIGRTFTRQEVDQFQAMHNRRYPNE